MNIRLITVTLGIVGLIGSLGLLANAGGTGDHETHTSYYTNGQAKETAEFAGGVRDGSCQRWYEDGTLRAEGRFDHGRMEGDWVWNTPSGTTDPTRTGTYEEGRRVAN